MLGTRKKEEENVEGEKLYLIEWESWLYKQPYSNRKIENKGTTAIDQFQIKQTTKYPIKIGIY